MSGMKKLNRYAREKRVVATPSKMLEKGKCLYDIYKLQ